MSTIKSGLVGLLLGGITAAIWLVLYLLLGSRLSGDELIIIVVAYAGGYATGAEKL